MTAVVVSAGAAGRLLLSVSVARRGCARTVLLSAEEYDARRPGLIVHPSTLRRSPANWWLAQRGLGVLLVRRGSVEGFPLCRSRRPLSGGGGGAAGRWAGPSAGVGARRRLSSLDRDLAVGVDAVAADRDRAAGKTELRGGFRNADAGLFPAGCAERALVRLEPREQVPVAQPIKRHRPPS
jgi:hypothetical protein